MTAQIEPPAPVAFDYAALTPADRSWLRDRTAAVKLTSRSIAAELISLGTTLLAVKERIGHGRFQEWCKAELPWSKTQTWRLMNVAKVFGGEKLHGGTFDPGALYLLAQPATPQGARSQALTLASTGRKLSSEIAKIIVNDWRKTPVLSKSTVRALAPDRTEDRKPVVIPAAPPGPWDAIEATLAEASTLHVSRVFVNDEEGSTYVVTVLDKDGKPRTEVGDDLAGALKRLAGMERKRTCPRCMVAKPIPQFSRNADLPDGVNRYCKQCERKRIAKWKGKKKKKRKADDTPAA